MKAISQGDFVLIPKETEFTVYKIALINGLSIFVFDHSDDVIELVRTETDYLYKDQKVFFMRADLQEHVNDFYDTLFIRDSQLDVNMPILKLDSFWASRYFNNFKNVKNILMIMNTKPPAMSWESFYKSMSVNYENTIYSDGLTREQSIFWTLWSWIGY